MRASVSAMRAVPERAGAEAGRAAQPSAAARPRPESHRVVELDAQVIRPTLALRPGGGYCRRRLPPGASERYSWSAPGGPMPSSDAVIPCRALAVFALAWCVGACAPRGEGSEPAAGPPVWLLARQKEQIAAGAASRVFHGFGFADRVDESGITFTRSAKPN